MTATEATPAVPPAPTLKTLAPWVGRELGLSDWLKIDQNVVDLFAACTGDNQWIHSDVARAKEGPFGGTIAHGWFLASLLAPWTLEALTNTVGCSQALNYGVDKMRFLTPVRTGSWVRGRIVLNLIEPRGQGQVVLVTNCTVEIQGQSKPALVATSLCLLALAQPQEMRA